MSIAHRLDYLITVTKASILCDIIKVLGTVYDITRAYPMIAEVVTPCLQVLKFPIPYASLPTITRFPQEIRGL